MEELFSSLCELSVKPAVATYKREDYALKLLKHFGFGRYTDIMHGADDKNVLKKCDIIEMCINESGVKDRSRIVMVGDTDGDRVGAERAGVDFIGVTYGFGYKTREDVMRGYAVGAAETPIEILDIIK
jgi:phosphoglycolate phosphatase